MRRIVVLASGNGSNAQALMDATADGRINGVISAVVSDRPTARVLDRARTAGVPALAVARVSGEARECHEERLVGAVTPFAPDLVVLAGWMRILTVRFLGSVGAPVVNLHPALPRELPGTRAIERAWGERHSGRTRSGVMVHLVPDEGVDTGPVLGSVEVPLAPHDTLEDFERRMHSAEHGLLVSVVGGIVDGRLSAGEGAHA
ncbi:MAG: phosphoribosylglycinamide formyltransferase [Ilumatobacteraceae bacterium]